MSLHFHLVKGSPGRKSTAKNKSVTATAFISAVHDVNNALTCYFLREFYSFFALNKLSCNKSFFL